ncbi:MAG: hypothetical protein GY896_01610 [Gammaproteobacteria bacterium]|nr:hypothetical protein [Gammaproteobacteria bacterium]
MKFPALFSRRYVILPTFTGLILLLSLLGLCVIWFFSHIGQFLSVSEPVGADYLVIEGWVKKDELNQAQQIFGQNGYQFGIAVGGPISDNFYGLDSNYAERSMKYLNGNGFPTGKLTMVAVPYSAQDRTFLSAVMVREWFQHHRIEVSHLDVFTSHVHSRRTRDLYQLAFGDNVRVGVIASTPAEFDIERWWQKSEAAKNIGVEFIGWLMVKCCFTPGEKGSQIEKWGAS